MDSFTTGYLCILSAWVLLDAADHRRESPVLFLCSLLVFLFLLLLTVGLS